MTSRIATHVLGFVGSHWRGRVPYRAVIVLVLICVGTGFIQLQRAVLGGHEAVVLGVAALSCLLVPVWQVVGYIRACRAHLEEGGDPLVTWAGHLVLVAILLATVSETIGSVLSLDRFQAQVVEGGPGDPLHVTQVGDAIRISGEIDYATHASVRDLLSARDGVSVIELESDGGLVYAARAIADMVLANALDTHAVGTCSSACTLIFAAGDQRLLAEAGRLGFHSYGRPTRFHQLMVDPGDEYARDLRFLRSRGVSDAFLSKSASVGNQSMWFPERAELLEAGVITR